MSWYGGPTLIEYLETVEVDQDARRAQPFRMPVQWVNRPDSTFRGFSGTVAGGIVRPGDRVRVYPSGRESSVARIVTFDGDLDAAVAGQAVTLTLADEIDVTRGDMIASTARTAPGRRPVRGDGLLDERRADAARAHLPPARRHEGRRRDDRPAQVQGQPRHARARRRDQARAERDRRLRHRALGADRLRPVRGEPRHRRLRPDRPAHLATRSAPGSSTSRFAGRRTSTGSRSTSTSRPAPPRSTSSPASSGSPVSPAPASRRSRTSSSGSCTRAAATPTSSTATTSATASTRTSASPTPTGSRTSAASPRSRT